MKRLLILVSCLTSLNSYAFNSLNLDKQIVSCNGESGTYTLSGKSSASDVIQNCKITHQETGHYALGKETEVEFNATVVTAVVCSYRNDKLGDCKFVK